MVLFGGEGGGEPVTFFSALCARHIIYYHDCLVNLRRRTVSNLYGRAASSKEKAVDSSKQST